MPPKNKKISKNLLNIESFDLVNQNLPDISKISKLDFSENKVNIEDIKNEDIKNDDEDIKSSFREEENEKIKINNNLSVNLQIDLSLNPWFKDLSNENPDYINKKLNEYLKLGHFINQMTQTHINEDILKKPIQEQFNILHQQFENKNEKLLSNFEGRMFENLERVKNSIEKFTEFSNKSSFKGAIGENIVETIVQNYFPDDTITNTSKKTAESDYHLQCHNGMMILLESKFYSSILNKNEIDKFKRDLIKTGFPIGIFISLSSGIVGKKRFDIEKINSNQWILFLPNAGLDGASIIWSILFAKEFYKTNQMIMTEKEIEYNWNEWEEMYDAFQQIYHSFATIKLNISETRNIINKQMDDLVHKSYDIHFQIQNLTNQMKRKIENQLLKKERLKLIEEQLSSFNQESEPLNINKIVEKSFNKMLDNNDQENIQLYTTLLDLCIKKNYNIVVGKTDEYEWFIYFGTQEIMRIKSLTKKKELILTKQKITLLLSFENIELLEKILI